MWSDVIVTEDSLTQCISDIRRALGDKEQKLVRTVPRRGYLFPDTSLEISGNLGNGLLERHAQRAYCLIPIICKEPRNYGHRHQGGETNTIASRLPESRQPTSAHIPLVDVLDKREGKYATRLRTLY